MSGALLPKEGGDTMTFVQKLTHEIREVALTTLYFAVWIGVLIVLKTLILAEYRIEFAGFSKIVIGSLILAKVVLVLQHVPLAGLTRSRPAWIDTLLRTALYSLGVFLVLIVENAYEGRELHGGFGPSFMSLFHEADIPHVWANTIALGGALLVYNCTQVVKLRLGAGGLARLFLSPLPEASRNDAQSTSPRADHPL
jgi:hypothetical protein